MLPTIPLHPYLHKLYQQKVALFFKKHPPLFNNIVNSSKTQTTQTHSPYHIHSFPNKEINHPSILLSSIMARALHQQDNFRKLSRSRGKKEDNASFKDETAGGDSTTRTNHLDIENRRSGNLLTPYR